jgi:deferrochelatase/peroxidase EfeB
MSDALENEKIQEFSETEQEVSGALENDADQDVSETVKEDDLVKNPVKKKRVMSEAQKECLKLAREKAVLYRLQLKEEKEKMGVKTEKKLNKTQLKLLKLKETKNNVEEKDQGVACSALGNVACSALGNVACSAVPNGNVKPIISDQIVKPIISDQIDACSAFPNDACSAFPDGNVKPSFFINKNGFYCI